MIQIRYIFGDWYPVTREKTLSWVKFMFTRLPWEKPRRMAYINGKHLRGITCEELLEWEAYEKQR